MSVTVDDIFRMADLAKLNITQEKVHEYTQNMNKLLDFAAQIKSIHTAGIEPMDHPFEGQTQRLRDDAMTEITAEQGREKLQKTASAILDVYYTVPKVIE